MSKNGCGPGSAQLGSKGLINSLSSPLKGIGIDPTRLPEVGLTAPPASRRLGNHGCELAGVDALLHGSPPGFHCEPPLGSQEHHRDNLLLQLLEDIHDLDEKFPTLVDGLDDDPDLLARDGSSL